MSTKPTTTRKAAAPAAVKQATTNRRKQTAAVPSPEMVNTFEEAIVPEQAAGRRSAGAAAARLFVKAWVNNVAYEKKVWVDVDLVGSSGHPLHSKSLPLGYVEPAGGSGDFFLVDASVPPSSSTRGEPAELLEYRLYYEVGGQVFTDGVSHRHRLRPRASSKNGLAKPAQTKARRASASRGA